MPTTERGGGRKETGRLARSKPRTLLERLRDDEEDVLRFMENPQAPYTNHQGEQDIRMTKVQQKYQGAFDPCTVRQCTANTQLYLDVPEKWGRCGLSSHKKL